MCMCMEDNYAINHFLLLFSSLFPDLQFPIDLSCVEKNVERDHPFLQKDQLQALYRRLLVLNRSATMRLDGQYNRNINVCRNFFSASFIRSYEISIFLTLLSETRDCPREKDSFNDLNLYFGLCLRRVG